MRTTPLILALSLPLAALAQDRPMGAGPAPDDARDLFGDCPIDLLRQAWTDMHPLQAGAVEVEVLKFCTNRSQEIGRFVTEHNQLGDAITALRSRNREQPAVAQPGPDPQTEGAASAEAARIASNSAEIVDLRNRIARLEAGPATPETGLALDRLRAELAEKEAERDGIETTLSANPEPMADHLAASEPAPEVQAQSATPVSDAVTAAMSDQPLPARAAVAMGTAILGPVVDIADEVASGAAQPAPFDTSGAGVDGLQPTPALQPGTPAAQEPVELPPDQPTQWQVIHAVRKGDGPWTVLFHGTREVAIFVPGATPQDPPTISWQTITEPPVTLTVGEPLPDGLILRSVTEDGVTLADPIAPEAEPQLLRFASDHTPGRLEWQVIDVTDAMEAGHDP